MYAPEKAEAEVITRGLAAISRPRLEVDVALDAGLAERQLDDCAYDVLLVGLTDPTQVPAFARSGPGDRPVGRRGVLPVVLPVVLVGGTPGKVKSNGVFRVPLPLSYTLLERSVRAALDLPEREDRRGGDRRRDQVG